MSIVKNHTQAAASYPIRSPAAKKRRQEVPPRLPVCVFYYPGGELLKKKLQRHTHKQAYPSTGIGKTCGISRRTPHQNPCAEAFPCLPAHQHGRESPVDQRASGA